MSNLNNTVEYFPHFANASEKRTIIVLETKFGISGYASWFKLLECLAKTDGHAINCSRDLDLQYLSSRLHVDCDTLTNILTTLSELSAIDTELWNNHKIIWSDNFIKQVSVVYKNRRREPPLKPVNNKLPTSNLRETYTLEGVEGVERGSREREYIKPLLGEFKNIKLTKEELEKLRGKFGEKETAEKIEILSQGIESKGYKYKSHYATILSWDRKDKRDNTQPKKDEQKGKYDHLVRR